MKAVVYTAYGGPEVLHLNLANALLIVPEDRNDVPAGEMLAAIPLDDGWPARAEPPV